tara:strand:+ start:23 stop:367 length:345 start_codon:yes stop_codon:yes gene_type:complete
MSDSIRKYYELHPEELDDLHKRFTFYSNNTSDVKEIKSIKEKNTPLNIEEVEHILSLLKHSETLIEKHKKKVIDLENKIKDLEKSWTLTIKENSDNLKKICKLEKEIKSLKTSS